MQTDILLNRTTSLKISTWIDDPAPDTGYAYPEEPLRGSDASVFFNLVTETAPDSWKWRQPPNLSETGMDVACLKEDPVLLADDFLCTTNTTITNIVVWGSWLYDELPLDPLGAGSPSNVVFTLSFHADIPAGGAATWSMPGAPLWVGTFGPGEYDVRVEAAQIVEGWYEPATSNYLPAADWTCWRYTFPVDITRAFVQTGTVDHPVVYWLDVQAKPIEEVPSARFGWKTTPTHWNDDACWAPAPEPYSGIWWEMRYPDNHPWVPESIDLAFMLFGGPAPEEPEWDFGDAPDLSVAGSPWNYPTRLATNGARHQIDPTGPWLGAPPDPLGLPDAETDGQPDINALGDDNNGYDDENGVQFPSFPPMVAGQSPIIHVLVSDGAGVGGTVDAWFDWNGDGDWNDPGEQVLAASWMGVGFNPVAIAIPANATNGWSFARFRISRRGGLTLAVAAPSGTFLGKTYARLRYP